VSTHLKLSVQLLELPPQLGAEFGHGVGVARCVPGRGREVSRIQCQTKPKGPGKGVSRPRRSGGPNGPCAVWGADYRRAVIEIRFFGRGNALVRRRCATVRLVDPCDVGVVVGGNLASQVQQRWWSIGSGMPCRQMARRWWGIFGARTGANDDR
jgi:hypothetical protein